MAENTTIGNEISGDKTSELQIRYYG